MMWEDRENRVLIITSRNTESNEAYRTMFVDLERLYFEIESKVSDSSHKLTMKAS